MGIATTRWMTCEGLSGLFEEEICSIIPSNVFEQGRFIMEDFEDANDIDCHERHLQYATQPSATGPLPRANHGDNIVLLHSEPTDHSAMQPGMDLSDHTWSG